MRVISGTARGTRLVSLGSANIRPTLDRVKESFFNQVGPGLQGVAFLDLFAGSGSMGIEALSRGAEIVVFVEPDLKAQNIIMQNLEKCKMTGENQILLKSTALMGLKTLKEQGQNFDLVFVDPPFADDLYEPTLLKLSSSGILRQDAVVVVEHFHKTVLQENYDKLKFYKDRRLGDSCLSFFSFEDSL
ncbi:MAG: 16S rRNA (guanine(966)-N(2))-methyltransferase RsmD [Nitrospina sp.]|jgi:16S rRNA (guanine966-N2)-methyltransferase|nr:16S rRNA (guanine(966)-N(2))-methyltransferase RsmD [Nitrospina sp.]MBT3509711.1 16S rRNA (guanine(966)-N(2))-methyltransferase RsmD [Nitrospina sp.]MBT3876394.1 16S rRNA (guanine(966)-N(2))-methyltransferase RsmD [Nitrospina sp.]MBT4049709.1 16S rRNA (guanine(966)-N(2))-methyltransferase RsmD [Nitrospina sp.]MBT4558809.1 16S rRNA (guanine(966)-N(2))-methyltransferase RsmD [Nitrospina sp.]